MSNIDDELANAIGAFKMQLDARPNKPSRETGFYGVVVRESSFGSQLPLAPAAAQKPVDSTPQPACGVNGYGPMNIVLTVEGVPNIPDGAYLFLWTATSGNICIFEFVDGLNADPNAHSGLILWGLPGGDSEGTGFFLVELVKNDYSAGFGNGNASNSLGTVMQNQALFSPGVGTGVISLP